jgi:hypothetical protein
MKLVVYQENSINSTDHHNPAFGILFDFIQQIAFQTSSCHLFWGLPANAYLGTVCTRSREVAKKNNSRIQPGPRVLCVFRQTCTCVVGTRSFRLRAYAKRSEVLVNEQITLRCEEEQAGQMRCREVAPAVAGTEEPKHEESRLPAS